jgi:hypothetical protein
MMKIVFLDHQNYKNNPCLYIFSTDFIFLEYFLNTFCMTILALSNNERDYSIYYMYTLL